MNGCTEPQETPFCVYDYYLQQNSSWKFHGYYCLMMFFSGKDTLEVFIKFLWGAYTLCQMNNKTEAKQNIAQNFNV